MCEKDSVLGYVADDDGTESSRKNLLRFVVEEPEKGVQILVTPSGRYRREVDKENKTLSLTLLDD